MTTVFRSHCLAQEASASAELVAHDATWTSGPPAQVPAIVEQYRARGGDEVALRIFATGGTTVHRSLVEQGEVGGILTLASSDRNRTTGTIGPCFDSRPPA